MEESASGGDSTNALPPEIPATDDGILRAFHFRPSPDDGLRSASVMAIIQPAEFGHLRLPDAWGSWGDAVLIDHNEKSA